MNKKTQILMSSLLLTSGLVWSQENTVSAGGEAMGTGGSASYSIGQIAYTYQEGSTANISQGVQQPYEFYFLGFDELNANVEVELFPNPTADLVLLRIPEIQEELQLTLFDLQGQLLHQQVINQAESQLEMGPYENGTYLLQISDQEQTLKTIKIIKNN